MHPEKERQARAVEPLFSQKSRFSHPIKSPGAKITGKFINFAIPKR